jgi:hypothetical protein
MRLSVRVLRRGNCARIALGPVLNLGRANDRGHTVRLSSAGWLRRRPDKLPANWVRSVPVGAFAISLAFDSGQERAFS